MKAQLEPGRNMAPEHIRHIHLIGICGTAMAALAGMLKARGFHVTGSDQNVYPPMSDFLASLDIPVQKGFLAEHLHPQPDLVIVGNVVRAVYPEAPSVTDGPQSPPRANFQPGHAEKSVSERYLEKNLNTS